MVAKNEAGILDKEVAVVNTNAEKVNRRMPDT